MGNYRKYLETHGGDAPTVQNLATLLQSAHGAALNAWGQDLRSPVNVNAAYNLADLLDLIASNLDGTN